MEFDKSKILTVVTADKAKVGQKGWFADELCTLMRMVRTCTPMTVEQVGVEGACRRFMTDQGIPFALFYPAPEQTYAERQAKWVKENNVKVGTKVRVTRTFTEDEDGSHCCEHDDLVGMTGSVDEYGIANHKLWITMSDGKFRAIPYFALEVIKEPTYEEKQAEWVAKNNIKVGTKVRFTKNFDEDADGSDCYEHRDAKGKEGFVDEIFRTNLCVVVEGVYWACPFTALEVIKEPTYRPFNEDELNDLVGKIVRNKQTGYRKLVTGKPTTSLGVNLEGKYINAKDLLNSFMMDDGNSPCGIKEEV